MSSEKEIGKLQAKVAQLERDRDHLYGIAWKHEMWIARVMGGFVALGIVREVLPFILSLKGAK